MPTRVRALRGAQHLVDISRSAADIRGWIRRLRDCTELGGFDRGSRRCGPWVFRYHVWRPHCRYESVPLAKR